MDLSRRGCISGIVSSAALGAILAYSIVNFDEASEYFEPYVCYNGVNEENIGPEFWEKIEESSLEHPEYSNQRLREEIPVEGPMVICYNLYVEGAEVDWKSSEMVSREFWDAGIKFHDYHSDSKIELDEIECGKKEVIEVDKYLGEISLPNAYLDYDQGIVDGHTPEIIRKNSVVVIHTPHEKVKSENIFQGSQKNKGFAISERAVLCKPANSISNSGRKIHEIGHTLGRGHNDEKKSVMHPNISSNNLTDEDLEIIYSNLT